MPRSAPLFLSVAAASVALALSACGSSESATPAAEPAVEPAPSPSGNNAGPTAPIDAGVADTAPPAPPAPKAVRMVVMGDTGTGDEGQTKIANAVEAKCKKDGCDFVQLLGDNLYPSGADSVNDPIWEERFETPYVAIDLDFFAVLGNHDYGANGAGTDFPKGKNEIDYTKKSKKWKMPSAYFHFVKENVELFELDTNAAFFSQAGTQKTDVNKWLAASTAEWKIALGHHPYKSNGPHGNAGNYEGLPIPVPPVSGAAVKSFLEGTICGKADIYFAGHDHSQQWLNESCSGTELAVSGAGAKTTELKGTNASLFESIELGFLYVAIEGKKLTAEFIDQNGKVEFTHTIKKP
jgi:predicted phosphodiesterase